MQDIQTDGKGYLGNPRLKRAGVPIQWSKERVEEYLKCKADPVYFIEKYVKIIHVDHGRVPFKMYKYQKKMVTTMSDNRYTIICTARQVGKSTTTAAFILHQILFHDDKTWGILANKGEVAREILGRIQLAYEQLPKWLQQGVVEYNKGSFELENGSRVIATATSSSSARGYSYSGIMIDEAAFIENWETFYKSVYPTISSGSKTKLILVSTPNGMNHYYDIWEKATAKDAAEKNNFVPVEVKWHEVPGRDEKWKAETIANTSIEQFEQEHNCEFLGGTATLISAAKLKTITIRNPKEIVRDCRIYEQPEAEHRYVMTVDVSHGKGIDYSAFTIIDVTSVPFRTVAVYYKNDIDPISYGQTIFYFAKLYNSAYVLVETNDIGIQVVNQLNFDYEYENLVSSASKGRLGKKPIFGGSLAYGAEYGVKTTKTVKGVGCNLLKALIERDQLVVVDKDQRRELSTFERKGTSYEAALDSNDDLAMNLVHFAWLTDSELFRDYTDNNIRTNLKLINDEQIVEQLLPFGFINDGTGDYDGEDYFTDELTGSVDDNYF